MPFTMGRKSKLKLMPLNIGKETFGHRLARIRKARGITQVELAKKIGLTQGLISDYELNKLRPYHDMLARFAIALNVSADELLGLKQQKSNGSGSSLKIQRRMNKIEDLPTAQQQILLKNIDMFLKGVEAERQ